MPQHIGQVRRGVPEILENESNELTSLGRRLVASLYDELVDLDNKIERIEKELRAVYQASEPPADCGGGGHRTSHGHSDRCRDE